MIYIFEDNENSPISYMLVKIFGNCIFTVEWPAKNGASFNRSFDRLTEIKRHKANHVDRQRYINRDTKARRDYYKIRDDVVSSKLKIEDILREEK